MSVVRSLLMLWHVFNTVLIYIALLQQTPGTVDEKALAESDRRRPTAKHKWVSIDGMNIPDWLV